MSKISNIEDSKDEKQPAKDSADTLRKKRLAKKREEQTRIWSSTMVGYGDWQKQADAFADESYLTSTCVCPARHPST